MNNPPNIISNDDIFKRIAHIKATVDSFAESTKFHMYNEKHELILTIDYEKAEQVINDLKYNMIIKKPYMVIMNAEIPGELEVEHHYHNHYEILTMLEGESTFGFKDKAVTLKKGDTLIVEPYELHNFSCDAACKIQIIISV